MQLCGAHELMFVFLAQRKSGGRSVSFSNDPPQEFGASSSSSSSSSSRRRKSTAPQQFNSPSRHSGVSGSGASDFTGFELDSNVQKRALDSPSNGIGSRSRKRRKVAPKKRSTNDGKFLCACFWIQIHSWELPLCMSAKTWTSVCKGTCHPISADSNSSRTSKSELWIFLPTKSARGREKDPKSLKRKGILLMFQ